MVVGLVAVGGLAVLFSDSHMSVPELAELIVVAVLRLELSEVDLAGDLTGSS
jgi:hypothetical protein